MRSAERVDLIISLIDDCLDEYERSTADEQHDSVQLSAFCNE